MNLSSPTPSPAPAAPPPTCVPGGGPRPPVTSDVQRLGADFERQLQERSLARSSDSSAGSTDSPRGGDGTSSLPRSETSVSYAVRGSYDQGGSQGDTGSDGHTAMFRQMFGDAPPLPGPSGGPLGGSAGDSPSLTTLSARSLGDTAPSPAPSLARMLGEPASSQPPQTLTTLSAQNPAADAGNPPALAGEQPPKPLKGETAKKPLSDAKQASLCRDTMGGAQSLRGPAAGSGQGTQSSQSAGGRGALARLTTGGQTEDPQADALAAMLQQQAPRGQALPQSSDGKLDQVGALVRHGGRGKGGVGHDDGPDRGEAFGDAFANTPALQSAPNSPPPTAAGMLPAEASKTQAALEAALRHSMPTSELGKAGTWEVSIPQAAGGTLELKATRAQPVTGNNMTAGWNLDIRTSRLDAEAFARQQSRLTERLQTRRVASHIRIEGSDGETTEDGGGEDR
ncbi:MAG TPA: hypothetical protein PKA20_29625 [Burkholderiaceae bacterium]|nr:hypothetical protein [Burkholderiaceae bacterium]